MEDDKLEATHLMGKKTDRVWIAKFTSDGLKNCHKNSEWLMASDYLNDLLIGEAVIIDD